MGLLVIGGNLQGGGKLKSRTAERPESDRGWAIYNLERSKFARRRSWWTTDQQTGKSMAVVVFAPAAEFRLDLGSCVTSASINCSIKSVTFRIFAEQKSRKLPETRGI
jgi:hypothetical protein